MTLHDALAVEAETDIQQDTVELLLQDRNWVEAEFAAIMNASGLGDRLIVATMPTPPKRDRRASTPDTSCRGPGARRFRSKTPGSRVRSPPRQS